MPPLQLGFAPPDRESLWWAVRAVFGVTIPRARVCPEHCAPFDAFADAYFGECTVVDGESVEPYEISRMVIHASRGLAGKSKTLSVLGLTYSYFLGADITILGGSMSQSANVHEYMRQGMNTDGLEPGLMLDATATRISLSNKGRIRPLPASQKNVRGPHPSVLLMDEVDEMEIDIYDAALGQPMPQQNYLGQTVQTMTAISSTWQNPSGTLTEIFRRADEEPRHLSGNPKTPIYRWCYKENHVANNPATIIDLGDGRTKELSEGWLTERTIQEKKDSISAEMFRVEYDLGEPSIGNRAFDGDAVDAVFSLPFEPIAQEVKKDFEEYTFAKPVRGAQYVAAADWAKEQDKTVIGVIRIDDNRRELVYYQRVNRRPYPVMIGAFNTAVRRYRVERNGAWHDSTGLGNVVNDYLDMRARPFPMTGDKRAKLLSDFVNAIEKSVETSLWRLPKVRSAWLEMKYCRTGDLYSNAQEYHLPDTVCMFALAEYAASKVQIMVAPQVVSREDRAPASTTAFEHPHEEERASLAEPGQGGGFSLSVG